MADLRLMSVDFINQLMGVPAIRRPWHSETMVEGRCCEKERPHTRGETMTLNSSGSKMKSLGCAPAADPSLVLGGLSPDLLTCVSTGSFWSSWLVLGLVFGAAGAP